MSHPCAGQSHDGFFEFARDGRVQHILGAAIAVDERGVRLKDGSVLPADMVIYAGGCEYQGSPPFLAELDLGEGTQASFSPCPASPRSMQPTCCPGIMLLLMGAMLCLCLIISACMLVNACQKQACACRLPAPAQLRIHGPQRAHCHRQRRPLLLCASWAQQAARYVLARL